MHDTVDKANLRAQRECVANSSLAAVRILNSDEWPVAHRTQEEIESLVKGRGYEETLALGARLKDFLTERRGQLRPEAKAYLDRLTASWEESI
jgi:hypothetical protein